MIRSALLLVLIALSLAATACDDDGGTQQPQASATQAPQQGGSEASPSADATGDRLTTVEIVDRLAPSIVRVETETATIDPFGRVVPGMGVGTGVIIDDDGHIVTNNHVVTAPGGNEPADTVTVTLADQSTVPATIVGRDAATDLAVLDIEQDDVDPAEWGDASELQVGQDVVAVGYALGLEGAPTVTEGVLSALNRTIEEPPYTIPEAIQTDASINPGNSGGPLVDARGRVIGINTAIIQNAQNIGFAISVALAMPIVEQLIEEGSIDRAYVGIATVDVNSRIATNLDLPVDAGVIVEFVAADTPADAAGLQRGDVIVQMDGEDIKNNGDLLRVLAERQAGDTVTVTYYRNGEQQETRLTLAERPVA